MTLIWPRVTFNRDTVGSNLFPDIIAASSVLHSRLDYAFVQVLSKSNVPSSNSRLWLCWSRVQCVICRFKTVQPIPVKFDMPLGTCSSHELAKFCPDPPSRSISAVRARLPVDLAWRLLADERRSPSPVCRSWILSAIHTKLCMHRPPTADSTPSKFQVDWTSHLETTVNARNLTLTWRLPASRPNSVSPQYRTHDTLDSDEIWPTVLQNITRF